MKIFSLSRLIDLSREVPPPSGRTASRFASTEVLRLPIRRWDPVQDAAHPEWELEHLADTFVEFQLTPVRNIRGAFAPRWVLRGVVAL